MPGIVLDVQQGKKDKDSCPNRAFILVKGKAIKDEQTHQYYEARWLRSSKKKIQQDNTEWGLVEKVKVSGIREMFMLLSDIYTDTYTFEFYSEQ